MAHRTHHAPEAMYSDVKTIYGHMTGNTTNDLIFVSGDVLTAVDTDVGDFTLTFRHPYPQGLYPDCKIIGSTVGLVCEFKTWDPATQTATVTFLVGTTPTDPAADDEIYFRFDVRNSGKNPATADL